MYGAKKKLRCALYIIAFHSVLMVVCALEFIFQNLFPSLRFWLGLTRLTPWGVLTSIFVHGSIDHLTANALFLTLSALYLGLLSIINGYSDRGKAASLFCFGPLVASVIANLVELLFTVTTSPRILSYGSSGLLYATIGTILATSSYNIMSRIRSSGFKAYLFDRKLRRSNFIPNLFILLAFLYLILSSSLFQESAGSETDVLGHRLGLLCGIAVTCLNLSRFAEKMLPMVASFANPTNLKMKILAFGYALTRFKKHRFG